MTLENPRSSKPHYHLTVIEYESDYMASLTGETARLCAELLHVNAPVSRWSLKTIIERNGILVGSSDGPADH